MNITVDVSNLMEVNDGNKHYFKPLKPTKRNYCRAGDDKDIICTSTAYYICNEPCQLFFKIINKDDYGLLGKDIIFFRDKFYIMDKESHYRNLKKLVEMNHGSWYYEKVLKEKGVI